MPGIYNHAKCPFWLSDDKQSISCECDSLSFPTKEAKYSFIRRWCGSADNWNQCPRAISALDYYEKKEEIRLRNCHNRLKESIKNLKGF